jgi:putative ABC transport system permease protein
VTRAALPGFPWILRALVGHWRRHPTQLGAMLLGLALATALWSGVQGVNSQARESYARAAETLGGAQITVYARPSGGAVDEALFGVLRRAGWPVSPVVEGRVRVGERIFRVLGVDPLSLPPGGALTGAAGAAASTGAGVETAIALFADPQPVIAAPDTLAELGLAEGDRLDIASAATDPPVLAREGVAAATLIADIGLAQRLTGMEGRVSRFIAPASWRGDAEELARLSGGALAPRPGAEMENDLAQLTDSFHLNLTAFGFLSFAVGLFIAHAAAGLAYEQRKPLIRTLRACGAPNRSLAAAMLTETLVFALLAGAVGMVLGYVITAALLPNVAATLRGIYAAPVSGEFSVAPAWWLSGLAMAVGGALAATGGKTIAAWRAPALATAQPQAWVAGARRRTLLQAGAACAFFAAAALIGALGEGLIAGFALLGALLLGAALALPPLVSVALAGALRLAKAPLLRWALADARQSLGGLSLALMALLLALAANIGVGAMVSGFRDAFDGWLDQRLAADLYVRPVDAAQADAFEALAATLPEVRRVLPSRDVSIRLDGQPVDLEGLVDDRIYRESWPLLDESADIWDALAAGEGALVSEQLSRRLGLSVGDRITAPAAEGDWPLRVVGIYPDYGNPRGQIVVNYAAHEARWPEARRGSYGVATAPGAAQAVLAALQTNPALDGAEMADQGVIKRFSLGVFDRTFAVSHALNALTLGVAGMALLASLTTLSEMRLAQAAPVWAMGAPRRRLAAMELARMAALGLLTALLAIPLGVALAWTLVAVVNVQAFGWRLPLSHYPSDWLRLGALAVVVATAAAALPAWRLARTPPARLAAVFAQER